MPRDTINLGLDLRGGSHLLLELDFAGYMQEQYAGLKDALRSELREARIGYRNLRSSGKGVSLELRDMNVADTAREIISELDAGLTFEQSGNRLSFHFSESRLNQKKLQLLQQSLEIVGRRVNQTGTKEPIIQRQGEERILVQVPGMNDPEALKDILNTTAKLSFHMVDESLSQEAITRGRVPRGTRLAPYQEEEGEANESDQARGVPIRTRAELSGENLTNAQATFYQGAPAVAFRFNPEGARKFGAITRNNPGKRFAILLDGKVISAPTINEPILDGSGIIHGNFTVESANQLALLLRAGALPAKLEIIEERTVGPSLGADSIAAGEMAVIIAFSAILVFMPLYYGIYGLFSNVALIMNVLLIVAALSLLQATLTLPGIAGIVLTMGMAVDANTLIFERIREELRLNKSIRRAVDQGFQTAFQTILDANVTTLIAAFILFYFGSGTVKGFAVTLSIGIIASMFSAIMLTRFMMVSWISWRKPATLSI